MPKPHRMYQCQNCDNVWVGRSNLEMRKCALCGDTDPRISVDLPEILALEMLRRNDALTFNVFNAVMDFSARIWGGKTKVNSDLFGQQIEIMTALYTVMREAHDKIRNV